MKKAILTMGNTLRGDDGVADLTGRRMEDASQWKVFYGGDTPENQFHNIRVYSPDIIVVIDAVTGIGEGTADFIDLDEDPGYSFATHNIPVQLLMKCLKIEYQNVLFLGIGIDKKHALEIGTGLSSKAERGSGRAMEKIEQLDMELTSL